MEKKLKVLLIEDDPKACDEIIAYSNLSEEIYLIAVTNDTKKGLEYVQDNLPDAVILDLELHTGSGNGLTFLNDLQLTDKIYKPYILITTHNPSTVTHEIARQNGADFIMTKYQEDYSAKAVIDFLISLKQILHTRKTNDNISFVESPDQKYKRLHQRICAELDIIGISPKVVGYKYLIDAILIIIDNPTPNICTIIGNKYSKTDSSVERAMQNAINKAWRYEDIEHLYNHYTAKISSEKGVPTVTELIYYYANKIKNNY